MAPSTMAWLLRPPDGENTRSREVSLCEISETFVCFQEDKHSRKLAEGAERANLDFSKLATCSKISAHSVFGKFNMFKANVKKRLQEITKDFKINNKVPVKFPFSTCF